LNSSAARPAPLDALTGIRFLAALHVVLYHYAGEIFASTHWAVRALIAAGPSAVGLFYVLSGAVLTYSCTVADGGLTSSRRAFWTARFARIYPTYLLALILDAPFFASALLKTQPCLSGTFQAGRSQSKRSSIRCSRPSPAAGAPRRHANWWPAHASSTYSP
jgi:peptidoglycan/LPS O-acetylase OafA/YrhL